ncbi:MAG: hypothetical protein ABI925_12935 [Verrucomicrobiota bacterium]
MNDAFNYIAVLVSIVTGLAATRILNAISDVIQVHNRPRAYWIHTLWMINVFSELMLYWWSFTAGTARESGPSSFSSG